MENSAHLFFQLVYMKFSRNGVGYELHMVLQCILSLDPDLGALPLPLYPDKCCVFLFLSPLFGL